MKFSVKTLGCKVNTYESEYIISLLLEKGFILCEENADIYIVNTCTVTNNADKKSKKIIHSIRKNNPNSILVVVGCFTQNVKDNIDVIDADIILGNYEKGKVVEYIEEFIKTKKKIVKLYDVSNVEFENMEIERYSTRSRAFVKIQDGCNNFCSYCIIPFVRGRVRSKKKSDVLKEVNTLVKNGHKEIVLTGIHTGQYGKDLDNYNFENLLVDLTKIEGLERIRISSIEINELTDNIINLLKTNKKIVSHLHIPLQSGCDKTLDNMNRRYNTKYFYKRIKEIRRARKDISITTDVIVGFPDETEKDFKETYKFCKKINFSKIHVFPYSDRTGTVASRMKNKVSDIEKKKRVKMLMDLSNKQEMNYYNKFINKEVEVLFEEEKDGYFIGHTPNYLKIKVSGDYELNEIYKIKLNKNNFDL